MALKDLVVEKGALDEAMIERIVEPYLRYDVDAKEIHFTHAFTSLPNKAKILVYLVALQGWRFVTEEPMPEDARPAEIEAATGILGGSLRPTLHNLSESRQVYERKSRYSVRGTSLSMIEAELNGGGQERPAARRHSSARRGKSSKKITGAGKAVAEGEDMVGDLFAEEGEATDGGAKKARKVGSKTGNVAATFERWINEGLFDEPRTVLDIQKRFRKEAIMIPRTSLPGYFLAAVRKGRLTREEVQANGRTVWAYTTAVNEKAKAE